MPSDSGEYDLNAVVVSDGLPVDFDGDNLVWTGIGSSGSADDCRVPGAYCLKFYVDDAPPCVVFDGDMSLRDVGEGVERSTRGILVEVLKATRWGVDYERLADAILAIDGGGDA